MTAKVVYNGDLRTTITHIKSGATGITDAPTDNRGQGNSFSPTDLVATATVSCMITIMGIKALDNGWAIEGMEGTVVKIMASQPRRIDTLQIEIIAPDGHGLTEKEQHILEKAALSCPVSKSLHADITQQVIFKW